MAIASLAVSAQVDTAQKLNEVSVYECYRIEASANHKVISLKDSINSAVAFNLAEQLKQGSAIFVKSYGANGIATLNIRGTGSGHTKVYWNGIDISSAGLGLMDLSLLPNSNSFEEMELSYGNGALAYSSGNLGGGLLLNSSPDFKSLYKQEFQWSGGSFGRQQGHFQNQYGKGNMRAQTLLSFATAQNNYAYRSPESEIRDQSLENADFHQFHFKQHLYHRLPNSLFSARLWVNQSKRNLPAISLSDQSLHDRMQDRNVYLNLDWQKQFAESGHLHWIGGAVYSSNRFYLNAGENFSWNEWLSYQTMLRYRLREKHLWNKGKINTQVSLQSRWDDISSTYTEARWTHAAFGQFNYDSYGPFNGQVQLRQEFTNGSGLTPLTGSLAIGYEISKEFHLFINGGRNYRLPSLNDLFWNPGGNPDLKPELSHNAELGLEHQIKKGPWSYNFSAHVFYMEVDNWIQWVPNNGIWRPQNFKRVRNSGAETSLKLLRRWKTNQAGFELQYQYLQSINASGTNDALNGKRTTYNPNHNLSGRLFFKYGQWQGSYQLNYTDRFFLDEANYFYMPSYLIQDLRLNYQWKINRHQLQSFVALNNIGNRDYQIIPWRPEPGIHFIIGLNWRWEKD